MLRGPSHEGASSFQNLPCKMIFWCFKSLGAQIYLKPKGPSQPSYTRETGDSAFKLGFAISRFFPELGNREMGGPEPVNPGFGLRFCMSYS